MILHLVLLQGELLRVVSAPEEPLLVVEVRSEFPRPGRGMLYSGAVTSLPAGRKIHRLSLVAGHLRHPGDDRPQGELQAGQVADLSLQIRNIISVDRYSIFVLSQIELSLIHPLV